MGRFMFIMFQIFIPILLLNMLIAMMGNTYATVSEKSEKEFLKQVSLLKFKTYINSNLNYLTTSRWQKPS